MQTMMNSGMITVKPVFNEPEHQIWDRLQKYTDINGSIADICLMHLYENEKRSRILTLDSGFQIYRDKKDKPIRLIYPQ